METLRTVWRTSWELPWEGGFFRVWKARATIIGLVVLTTILISILMGIGSLLWQGLGR